MWTWSLNWGRITDNIFIGTCPMGPGDLKKIRFETDITGVLSLQHDDCLSYWGIDYAIMARTGTAQGLEMERCPIRDLSVPDMRKRLPEAIIMLSNMIAHNHRVYVHCTAGMGRSATVVLGYLIMVKGHLPGDAIRLILDGRPESLPAWEAYQGAREDLVTRYRTAIEQRAYALYELGIHGNATADWLQAEHEILHSVLTQIRNEY